MRNQIDPSPRRRFLRVRGHERTWFALVNWKRGRNFLTNEEGVLLTNELGEILQTAPAVGLQDTGRPVLTNEDGERFTDENGQLLTTDSSETITAIDRPVLTNEAGERLTNEDEKLITN